MLMLAVVTAVVVAVVMAVDVAVKAVAVVVKTAVAVKAVAVVVKAVVHPVVTALPLLPPLNERFTESIPAVKRLTDLLCLMSF